jgi:hypothetical protein
LRNEISGGVVDLKEGQENRSVELGSGDVEEEGVSGSSVDKIGTKRKRSDSIHDEEEDPGSKVITEDDEQPVRRVAGSVGKTQRIPAALRAQEQFQVTGFEPQDVHVFFDEWPSEDGIVPPTIMDADQYRKVFPDSPPIAYFSYVAEYYYKDFDAEQYDRLQEQFAALQEDRRRLAARLAEVEDEDGAVSYRNKPTITRVSAIPPVHLASTNWKAITKFRDYLEEGGFDHKCSEHIEHRNGLILPSIRVSIGMRLKAVLGSSVMPTDKTHLSWDHETFFRYLAIVYEKPNAKLGGAESTLENRLRAINPGVLWNDDIAPFEVYKLEVIETFRKTGEDIKEARPRAVEILMKGLISEEHFPPWYDSNNRKRDGVPKGNRHYHWELEGLLKKGDGVRIRSVYDFLAKLDVLFVKYNAAYL